MLALAGHAFDIPCTILLDSCAEVSLAGAKFLRELKEHNVQYTLREPTLTVVGAHKDLELAVLGEIDVPLTFTDTKGKKVGTEVTFVVAESYDGGLLLAWDLIESWGVNINGRREGTFVSFERWPGCVFPDHRVAGEVWAEAMRVRAVIRNEVKEEKAPRIVISVKTREQIFADPLFRKGASKFEEVTAKHVDRLRYLSEKKVPCVVAMRATMGSPLLEFFDSMISLPVLVWGLDKTLYVVSWMGKPQDAAVWHKTRVDREAVLARLLLFVKDRREEARKVAENLASYWVDAFYPDELSWRQLREGTPDDIEDDHVYPPEVSDTKRAPKPKSLEDFTALIRCRLENRRVEVARALREYADIIGEANTSNVRDYAHHITLSAPSDFVERPRKYSAEDMALIEKKCQELEKEGFIRQAKDESPLVSAPLLVPKKDAQGKLTDKRFCIDYRRLNRATVKDRYNLPAMDDCLMLRSGRVFSKIDLRSAFWQIPIAPGSQAKTGFQVGNKVYVWLKMPFGLTNAPATMQRLIDRCIGDAIGKFAIAYLDDIIVYSDNEAQHLSHIKSIFKRLHAFGLRINPEKCEFFCRQVVFLGHLISHGEIRIDPDKVSGIKGLERPHDVKSLQRVLGIFGYCRKFILNYAALTVPLTDLLKKDQPWVWGKSQQDSFDRLKELFTKDPVLAQPDFGKEFELETDASDYGIGALLGQRDEKGFLRPVSFISRKLTPAEKNYSTREKEGLAIVWAIEKLSPMLWGRRFTVYTDHKSLIWLKSAMVDSGRLTRWVQKLSAFDFDIKYRKGSDNVVADALSRAPASVLTISRDGKISVSSEPLEEPIVFAPKRRRSQAVKKRERKERARARSGYVRSQPGSAYQPKILLGSGGVVERAVAVLTLEDKEFVPLSLPLPPTMTGSASMISSSSSSTVSSASSAVSMGSSSSTSPATGVAPQLSSLPIPSEQKPKARLAPGMSVPDGEYQLPDRDRWVGALNSDPEYSKLIKFLTKHELPSDLREREHMKALSGLYFVEDGLLYFRASTAEGEVYLLEVPHAFRRDMVRLYHDHALAGHRNAVTVCKLILRNYRWEGLQRDVSDYIKECLICKLAKAPSPRRQGLLCQQGSEVAKFEVIHIDFVGPIMNGTPRGNRYILTVKDRGTGFLEALPCKDSTAETAALLLWERWFTKYGIPKAIISDLGQPFRGKLFDSLRKVLQIDLRKTTAYHPQANGLVEREHSTLKSYMRAYCMEDTRAWDLKLPSFVFVANNTMKARLAYPPYFLVFGTYPRLPSLSLDNNLTIYQVDEYVTEMLDGLKRATALHHEQKKAQEAREKQAYDFHHQDVEFGPGDIVWRYIPRSFSGPLGKFAIPWTGPFRVKRKLDDKPTYVIVDVAGKEHVVHVSQLSMFGAYSKDLMREEAPGTGPTPSLAELLEASAAHQRELLPPERQDSPERKRRFGESRSPMTNDSFNPALLFKPGLSTVEEKKAPPPSTRATGPSGLEQPHSSLAEGFDRKVADEQVSPELPVVLTPRVPIPPEEELKGQFVIISAYDRPGEEFLLKVIGPGLLSHRFVARHRQESGVKKVYAPLYLDTRIGKWETLTGKQLKRIPKGRSPDYYTVQREEILYAFSRLVRGQIGADHYEKFLSAYFRAPNISWKPTQVPSAE